MDRTRPVNSIIRDLGFKIFSEGRFLGKSGYRALLRHFGISAWRAAIEYTALRLFGGAHYKKGKN